MAKVTRREWYERVNAAWPDQVPQLTADEAVKAARRLYRFGTGRTWRGEVRVTSGNRDTWIRRGVLYVNPGKGWHELVHMLSHWCEPGVHGAAHARAELRMIRQVVRRGWLGGKLRAQAKPERPPVDARALREQRLAQRIARWEAKLRRATNALRKLRAQYRRCRSMAARVQAHQQTLDRAA